MGVKSKIVLVLIFCALWWTPVSAWAEWDEKALVYHGVSVLEGDPKTLIELPSGRRVFFGELLLGIKGLDDEVYIYDLLFGNVSRYNESSFFYYGPHDLYLYDSSQRKFVKSSPTASLGELIAPKGAIVFVGSEVRAGSPLPPTDSDGDGIPDTGDNCPSVSNTSQADEDNDGVGDLCDNCIGVSNEDQRNTNGDVFGNVCDPDLDNDNVVGILDFNIFRNAWLETTGDSAFNPDADLDGDGVVGILDFNIFRDHWLQPPGPSGVVP